MKTTTMLLAVLLAAGCAAAPHPAAAPEPAPQAPAPPATLSTTTARSGGGMQITGEMIGRQYPPLSLTKMATDPAYGTEKRAIRIGGGFGEGSHRVYGYLNALRGPNGEPVHYDRVGTCCPYPSKDSPLGEGLLEIYEVTYEGGAPRRLYFDWDVSEEPLIVVGFTAAK